MFVSNTRVFWYLMGSGFSLSVVPRAHQSSVILFQALSILSHLLKIHVSLLTQDLSCLDTVSAAAPVDLLILIGLIGFMKMLR